MIDPKANYIIHTDYDDPEDVGVYGPMPEDADLNDAASDLFAQCGEIEEATGSEVIDQFGDHECNPWSVWLAFGE